MKEWTRKPRLLVVGDSSALHTGFATIIKSICTNFYELNQYEIKTIGWFHNKNDATIPYEIITTKNNTRQLLEQDKYSILTFPEVVKSYKPDLVIAVGDPWMIDHTVAVRQKNDFKLMLYVPVDGMPMMGKWGPVLKGADVVVAYGEFGKGVMKDRFPELDNIICINHGIDTDIFKPIPKAERDGIRAGFGGEDLFIIGTVCRNQPRKILPRLIKAFRLFVNDYTVCPDCDEMFLEEVDLCPICGCKTVENFAGKSKDDVRLYLHMALQDCGWDIPDLVNRFDLVGYIAYPQGLKIGAGVDVDVLVKLINSLDVFTLPTGGEGWGLPIIEAMACGIPSVVTNYSAHVDFCQNATELIKVSEYFTEAGTNVERALVDIYDYVMRLDKLYMNDTNAFLKKWGKYLKENYPESNTEHVVTGKAARDFLSKVSLDRASRYSWDRINKEWEEAVNNCLGYNPEMAVIEESVPDVSFEEV